MIRKARRAIRKVNVVLNSRLLLRCRAQPDSFSSHLLLAEKYQVNENAQPHSGDDRHRQVFRIKQPE